MQPQNINTEKKSFKKWFLSSQKNKVWAIFFHIIALFVNYRAIQSYMYNGSLVALFSACAIPLIILLYWILTYRNYKQK